MYHDIGTTRTPFWQERERKISKELEEAQARIAELEAGIRKFIECEDEHKPGPYIKDGNWHPGPCVPGGPRMEDIHPDGFQVCADEDCGLYWPCHIAELAELLPEDDVI